MLRRMLIVPALAVLVVLPMLSLPVLAHHSGAAFSDSQTVVKGTVVEYIWRNPHIRVVWDTKDASGKVVRWSGEMASVTSMLADGMTKDSLKPGDELSLRIKPSRAGTPVSIIVQIQRPDGTWVLKQGRRGGKAPDDSPKEGY